MTTVIELTFKGKDVRIELPGKFDLEVGDDIDLTAADKNTLQLRNVRTGQIAYAELQGDDRR